MDNLKYRKIIKVILVVLAIFSWALFLVSCYSFLQLPKQVAWDFIKVTIDGAVAIVWTWLAIYYKVES
jgi:hypothetical protein